MKNSTETTIWKEEGGEMRRDYGYGMSAAVPTECEDWFGRTVHRWKVWRTITGGRLDGTNYVIGRTVLKEGVADTLEEAMAACDRYAE